MSDATSDSSRNLIIRRFEKCSYSSSERIVPVLSQMTPNGLLEVAEFDTKDGIYDCAWSEVLLASS